MALRPVAAAAVGALVLAGGAAGMLGVQGAFDGPPDGLLGGLSGGTSGGVPGGTTAGSGRAAPPDATGRGDPRTTTPGGRAGPGADTRTGPDAGRSAPREPGSPSAPQAKGSITSDDAGPTIVPAGPARDADPGTLAGSSPPQDDGTLTVPGTDGTGGADSADGYRADGPSSHTDHRALDYFQANWGPDDKALRRVRDIRTVGGYLRIYTDLPESAHNSRTAITLCERGLDYLRAAGVPRPVVFVQARFGENGNPVLANILGPGDRSCTVTHPAPG
ncbi:hypothetical protein MF672_027330 [Actinomadura sp. ATCC 31491]|uniref:Uncharacterized protein n=1 Tax=Actinomadura luzonensis TaxID=2805427 RepID=A0ABT0FYP7_9ACTN|nr:hypothetical protein [Actinomadura luzonensis]MCK2217474.1 hypothetical protein [Actinomadura luzonensis]